MKALEVAAIKKQIETLECNKAFELENISKYQSEISHYESLVRTAASKLSAAEERVVLIDKEISNIQGRALMLDDTNEEAISPMVS